MKRFFLILIISLIASGIQGQTYRNSEAPIEERVRDLIKRMTPEEKFWQLFMIPGDLTIGKEKLMTGIFGFQVSTEGRSAGATQQLLNYSPGASAGEAARQINEIQRFFREESRLGIPVIPFDEGLHGLVRRGATSFPQAIGLAATFDTELVGRVARAIARESRSRGIRQILSPVINIASDVRWGRVEETYGEDPFLASEMSVAFVSEFENLGIITTPKHLIANVGDGGRDSYPIHLSERYLREIHLPPFASSFNRGGTRSVMTSYNTYDGQFCSGNNWILNRWLKEEMHFDGFVISDANAVGGANVLHMTAQEYWQSGADAMNGGLDVIFQTSHDHGALFIDGFLNGAIPQEVIDQAVARVLKAKFELGLFEDPYVDPAEAERLNGHPEHREVALEAARKSIVLLKNEKDILPLATNSQKIAVIGQDAMEARLGGYSGPGINRISILEGLRQRCQGTSTEIFYAPGVPREEAALIPVPPSALFHQDGSGRKQGLKGLYYNNISFEGDPVISRIDPQIRFQWTLFGPDQAKTGNQFYSVRWSGQLLSPGSGTWRIGIDGNDGYRLFIDDELVIDNWVKRTKGVVTVPYRFESGRVYDIRIDYYEPAGNAWFSLVWDKGINPSDSALAEAITLATKADLAVIVAGIEEGEFRDRALLGLPGRQEELILRVASTGKPVIVVLVGGSAVTMSGWLDDVDGLLDVWYPGEAGGQAVAEVLFGDYNPAGRLPVTFPVHEGQCPLVYNHKPTGRGDDYLNLTGQPLFPFGFGLSYTTFDYQDIRLEHHSVKAGESTKLSFTLTNSGPVAGEEVVQLYIRDDYASLARPVLELKGFQRVSLNPGESRVITFDITPDLLMMLDINLKPVIEPGTFTLMVGGSSKDLRLKVALSTL